MQRSVLFGLFTALSALGIVGTGGCLAEDDFDVVDDAGAGGGQAGGAAGGGTDGQGGGASGGAIVIDFIESEAPATLAFGAAHSALVALAERAEFTTAHLGDPSAYAGSDATTPTAPDELASLYLETPGFHTDVQVVQDKRTGVMADAMIGAALAQTFIQDLTLGAASENPPDERGGAHYVALHAVRTLDTYLILRALQGFEERSGAGYDRALGLLFDADGAPSGLGALIADADAACGTDVLAELRSALAAIRGPFVAALEEKGQLDPLDRKVIRQGDSPEYDAFIPQADRLLHEGLALSLLAALTPMPLTALDQARAQGIYTALSARVLAGNPDADAFIGQQLDQALPSQVDVAGMPGAPGIAGLLTAAFGVPCAR